MVCKCGNPINPKLFPACNKCGKFEPVPDPETARASFVDFECGEYLTTEELLAEIKVRINA